MGKGEEGLGRPEKDGHIIALTNRSPNHTTLPALYTGEAPMWDVGWGGSEGGYLGSVWTDWDG